MRDLAAPAEVHCPRIPTFATHATKNNAARRTDLRPGGEVLRKVKPDLRRFQPAAGVKKRSASARVATISVSSPTPVVSSTRST